MELRHVEGGAQSLLDKLEMRFGLKGGVEGNDRSGAFQTVSRHFELLGGVDVLHAELDAGTRRGAAQPNVQVSFFARLEKKEVEAAVHVAELRHLGRHLFFLQLRLHLQH